jgi:S-adenosyl methyltransferase
MHRSDWVPDEIVLDRPNVARMWDYFLGGAHNFAVDREAAQQVIMAYPDLPLVARATRAFLGRVVRFMLDMGVDQFLDIGAGIPTANSVHEIAKRITNTARVAYVDIDPVAVAHSRSILQHTLGTVAVEADARRPEEIVTHPEVRRVLDWNRPIAILAIAIFHFVADDSEALRIVRTLCDALPGGSYLALTHATHDRVDAPNVARVEEVYERTSVPFHFRTRSQIARLFEGLELTEPGVVYLPLWRPETDADLLLDQPDRASAYAGVGRRP